MQPFGGGWASERRGRQDGGFEDRRVATLAYDPAADHWEKLPDAPVPLSEFGRTVWTGDELVYVGPDLTVCDFF